VDPGLEFLSLGLGLTFGLWRLRLVEEADQRCNCGGPRESGLDPRGERGGDTGLEFLGPGLRLTFGVLLLMRLVEERDKRCNCGESHESGREPGHERRTGGAAQRLRKPRSAPRPFYRLWSPPIPIHRLRVGECTTAVKTRSI